MHMRVGSPVCGLPRTWGLLHTYGACYTHMRVYGGCHDGAHLYGGLLHTYEGCHMHMGVGIEGVCL